MGKNRSRGNRRRGRTAGDPDRAALYLATADDYQRHVKGWTVTARGPYPSGRYFIRLSPTGQPNAAETYDLGNGSLAKVDQRSVIDTGFLELTRLGELPANDPDVLASLKVADSVIESQTASGPGWHRYGIKASGSTDGYGDCYMPDPTNCSPSGAPWFPKAAGSGHLWPVLDGERAEQNLQTGDTAGAAGLLQTMQNMTSGFGLVPEQVWEDPDLAASPYGSAQYVRLVADLAAGKVTDQPAITADRYVTNGPPTALPTAITSPVAKTVISGNHATVSGATTPGAEVVISVGQPGSKTGTTTLLRTAASATGRFQVTAPVPAGTSVITATATAGQRATGWAQVTVKHS